MKSCKLSYTALFFSAVCMLFSSPTWAVIILDNTYKKYGFEKAEALALLPQFSSLIFLEGESESGSGSWIGNDDGHGYVLTAGHMFPSGTDVSAYSYQTLDGTKYKGDMLFLHPLWNDNTDDRTGYDFAIVRLEKNVTTAGEQPAIYDGNAEKGQKLTFIGYGWRGTGLKGEDTSIDTGNRPAAAEGLIEQVVNAVTPIPKTGDAGNYFGVWLPKEDGSLDNPLDENGITEPVSPLAGILGSGDSGGPAWIKTENGWAIAGVNSNGNGNAKYGNVSWFPRASRVKGWIKHLVPTARFIDGKTAVMSTTSPAPHSKASP